ncbi:MAG: hypothetical protein KAT14_08710, partial [Candidatus Marinimicrobia bacterium]|nr:hypothetical protein [Candidatus Neomarinimicrobiota bacterium]
DSSGTWHGGIALTHTTRKVAFPAVGVDSTGVVHIVVQRWLGGNGIVYGRKPVGGSWSWVLLVPETAEWRHCSMFTDSNGGIHATWKAYRQLGQYRYVASGGNLASGIHYTIPTAPGAHTNCMGDSFVTGDGTVHHAFTSFGTRTIDYSVKPPGGVFGATTGLNEGSFPVCGPPYEYDPWPAVAASDSGYVAVTWAELDTSCNVSKVYLSQLESGSWTRTLIDNNARIDHASRSVVTLTNNGLYLVWRSNTGELILTTVGISPPSISILYPLGGEEFGIGDTIPISWTTESMTGEVEISLRKSDDSGGYIIDENVPYNGSPYDYTIPTDIPTGFYFVRIKQGTVVDDSGIFEIVPSGTAASITVTYPNGGEIITAGSSVTLTWTYTGTISNVKIEFSPDNGENWTMLFDSVPNTGSYTDTIPAYTPPSSNCLVRISDASDGTPSDTSDAVFTIIEPATTPLINLSMDSLYYGTNSTVTTKSQSFLISNSGIGILNWTVSDDMSWLTCSPTSGTESGKVTCTIDPTGLSTGTYTATVTVSDPNAANSPQTMQITLNVYNPDGTAPPFGSLDSPVNNSDVFGSIPVTGWALDDIEVEDVLVKREPVASDPPEAIGSDGLVFIGYAVFVDGARPDVEAIHSTYPLCYRAGWGYQLLTNALPAGGNGTYVLHAVAYDKDGHEVDLGTKTINVDNA